MKRGQGQNMSEITIRAIDALTYEVTVASACTTTHQVSLEENDFLQLTQGNGTQQELLRASFEFLLEREPNTSILSSFELMLISTYFPEYPQEMKTHFQT